MDKPKKGLKYLACENKITFLLLMMTAGMMGAYTFKMRGGIFCNAQTANVVMMGIAFGEKRWSDAFYFLIPITAYFLGAVISEFMPNPIKRLGFLRWDTYLCGFEMIILFILGFVPLSMPDQIAQVTINFIASMQYNTFRQAEGMPMATTFCTNHIRQVGISFVKVMKGKDHDGRLKRKGLMHICMLSVFLGGAIILTLSCSFLQERAIWLALIPLAVLFIRLVYADLKEEHDYLDCKPSGH